jgi:protein-S-isoprenylcysteine O-methyltransferase Ste14
LTPFASQADRTVFFVIYSIWILTFIIERVVISSSGQSATKIKSDKGSYLLIFASIFLSITIAFTFAYAGIMILPLWVFYVGIGMMVIGLLVREWAVVTLRKFFSFTVRVREDHSIVQTGPYRLVRHPAYSGTMLIVIGVACALRSLAGIVILIIFFTLAFTYRITVEEKLLTQQLGQSYMEYMKRTKRLIPYIL